jgi:uracil-DNA glycosylase
MNLVHDNRQILVRAIDDLPSDWRSIMLSKELRSILSTVIDKISNEQLCPAPSNVFRAFNLCSWRSLRVVIVGQDPYHTSVNSNEPVANGLAFSTNGKIQPSLKTIYESLRESGEISTIPLHGNLTSWAKQGCLLLNASLTTISGKPNYHAKEWEEFTNKIISIITANKDNVVFMLWGKFAKKYIHIIQQNPTHYILTWTHPSPLAEALLHNTHRSFVYNNHFKLANEYIKSKNMSTINWNCNFEPTLFIKRNATTTSALLLLHLEVADPDQYIKTWDASTNDIVAILELLDYHNLDSAYTITNIVKLTNIIASMGWRTSLIDFVNSVPVDDGSMRYKFYQFVTAQVDDTEIKKTLCNSIGLTSVY